MSDSWKQWERVVAEKLSRWLTEGKCRTVVSRQSLMGRMVERIYGDMAIHPDCPEKHLPIARLFMDWFYVDAKNRQAFRLPGLLTQAKHPFWGWWNKLSGDVKPQTKFRLMPLLEGTSKAHIVVTGSWERGVFDGLFNRFKAPYMVMPASRQTDGRDSSILICTLEDLLGWIDPSILITAKKEACCGCVVPAEEEGGSKVPGQAV